MEETDGSNVGDGVTVGVEVSVGVEVMVSVRTPDLVIGTRGVGEMPGSITGWLVGNSIDSVAVFGTVNCSVVEAARTGNANNKSDASMTNEANDNATEFCFKKSTH
jgi:hypothetical protein